MLDPNEISTDIIPASERHRLKHGLSSRDIAMFLVSKVPDGVVRTVAEQSLCQGADMNLMVQAFHCMYGLPIITPANATPDFNHISKERLAMRFGLIVEEFMELCEAMDIRADINFFYHDEEGCYKAAGGKVLKAEHHDELSEAEHSEIVRLRCREAIEQTDERSIVDIADATFDLKYVIIGFEYEVGINPQACAEEGQCSNMSKLGKDGNVIKREDGKVLKGPMFFRPDMSRALSAYGMRGI
jgi:predicted HAD superfamily Cof-like phosphohydrolase